MLRDRVGLVFLTVAPIVVITVAGLSLASLYGADPRGETAYVLPLVDEDGGEIGKAIREALRDEPAVELFAVSSREAAQRLLDRREAGAALVIPAGATRAVEEGKPARLLLYTDPVKYLEIANLRALLQEVRHGLERTALDRAATRLEETRRAAEAARAQFESLDRRVEGEVTKLWARLAEARADLERRSLAAGREARSEVRKAVAAAAESRAAEVRRRLERELSPLRSFLEELGARQREFESWLSDVKERAGSQAAKLPPPPSPPAIPPALAELARLDGADLARRLAPPGDEQVALPELSKLSLPPLPALPAFELPGPAELPAVRLPGTLEIEETSVTGAPRRLNTFDQNVPGFSVTFLLLGMLLGVSMGLLDERDWGTLERLRAMPAPFSVSLVSKLLSRVFVGTLQMGLLFAVGRAAFGVSLGPEPWALALPTAGIVFAATAFGLVVAGLVNSRESVLPLGTIAIVTMAAVGGCWWPIDLEPRWMRTAALAFPTTWAMAAFNDLMIRRQPAAAAVQPTLVLFGYGLAYLAAGLWLFRRHLGSR